MTLGGAKARGPLTYKKASKARRGGWLERGASCLLTLASQHPLNALRSVLHRDRTILTKHIERPRRMRE